MPYTPGMPGPDAPGGDSEAQPGGPETGGSEGHEPTPSTPHELPDGDGMNQSGHGSNHPQADEADGDDDYDEEAVSPNPAHGSRLPPDALAAQWAALQARLTERFGMDPDLNVVLMLIGIQEVGVIGEKYSKEQKQDLMHVGVCTLLEPLGYYELLGKDQDGWPHWRMTEPLPMLNLVQQESLLKEQVVAYFAQDK